MIFARGVTLVELLVVIVLLGMMAGVVGLAWHPGGWETTPSASGEADTGHIIAAARRRALESGVPTTAVVTEGDRRIKVLALPDGRVVDAERFGIDPLSGLPAARVDSGAR